MLDGKWGSGKTYFINNILKKKFEDEHRLIYISLNGVSNIRDVNFRFIVERYAWLSKTRKTNIGHISIALLQESIAVIGRSDALVKVTPKGFNKIDISKLIDISNCTIVLDDLERMNINDDQYIELFGTIADTYLKDDTVNILYVCDESVMKRVKNYSLIKEKYIGWTFTYNIPLEDSIDSMLEKYPQSTINYVVINKQFIVDFADSISLVNRRTFIFYLDVINNLLPSLTKFDPCIQKSILYSLLVVIDEYKNGNITFDGSMPTLPLYLVLHGNVYPDLSDDQKVIYNENFKKFRSNKVILENRSCITYVYHDAMARLLYRDFNSEEEVEELLAVLAKQVDNEIGTQFSRDLKALDLFQYSSQSDHTVLFYRMTGMAKKGTYDALQVSKLIHVLLRKLDEGYGPYMPYNKPTFNPWIVEMMENLSFHNLTEFEISKVYDELREILYDDNAIRALERRFEEQKLNNRTRSLEILSSLEIAKMTRNDYYKVFREVHPHDSFNWIINNIDNRSFLEVLCVNITNYQNYSPNPVDYKPGIYNLKAIKQIIINKKSAYENKLIDKFWLDKIVAHIDGLQRILASR